MPVLRATWTAVMLAPSLLPPSWLALPPPACSRARLSSPPRPPIQRGPTAPPPPPPSPRMPPARRAPDPRRRRLSRPARSPRGQRWRRWGRQSAATCNGERWRARRTPEKGGKCLFLWIFIAEYPRGKSWINSGTNFSLYFFRQYDWDVNYKSSRAPFFPFIQTWYYFWLKQVCCNRGSRFKGGGKSKMRRPPLPREHKTQTPFVSRIFCEKSNLKFKRVKSPGGGGLALAAGGWRTRLSCGRCSPETHTGKKKRNKNE